MIPGYNSEKLISGKSCLDVVGMLGMFRPMELGVGVEKGPSGK